MLIELLVVRAAELSNVIQSLATLIRGFGS